MTKDENRTEQASAPRNKPTSPFNTKFDELISGLLKELHVPGISFAFVDGDEVFAKGFGLADLPSTAAAPESLYYIGSITKNVFATSLTKYIQAQKDVKNKITLQSKMVDIIRDDFALLDPWATNHLTLEDALCHRTGMTRHDLMYGGSCKTARDVTRALRYIPLSNEPRHKYDYCNTMYMAASHATETITGEPLASTIKKQVLQPLSMHHTYASRQAAYDNSHGTYQLYNGYLWNGKFDSGKGQFLKADHVELDVASGAGFLISNVLDMAKYVKAWLGQSNDVLSQELRDEVSRPRIVDGKNTHNKEYSQYALGLSRQNYHGVEVIGHSGGLTGYSSLMNFVPALNMGMIALGNGSAAVGVGEEAFFYVLNERLSVDPKNRFNFASFYKKIFNEDSERLPLKEIIAKQYASLPTIRLPIWGQMKNYAGSFWHPAYRGFTFEVKPGTPYSNMSPYLEASAPDRAWPFMLQLFHVSDDYWVGLILRGLKEFEGQRLAPFRAIARRAADGVVSEWGLELEPAQVRADWRDKLLWFEREEERTATIE